MQVVQKNLVWVLLLGLWGGANLWAQDVNDVNAVSDVNVPAEEVVQNAEFIKAGAASQQRLEEALSELDTLRESIAAQQLPLSKKLRELEDELIQVRAEHQDKTRYLDTRILDLTNLRAEIKTRNQEKAYLSNLLVDYVQKFDTRLHIAEMRRYRDPLEAATLAPENSNLTDIEIYEAQAALVTTSLERLEESLGGMRFKGQAVNSSGVVNQGQFVMMGPAALFRSNDGLNVGTAEQRLGSLEPTIIGFENKTDTGNADQTVQTAVGIFPLDPTLGNAHKIEATKQTLLEHIQKGGVVMYPILGLFSVAMMIAIYKWIDLSRLKVPTEKGINALLRAVGNHDEKKVAEEAEKIGGPTGEMLSMGIDHIREPHDLVEEVMFEKILTSKLKMNSLLPFIAVSAASAPLLGLLGTVTGIINTFKLITVFGSGDVKTLSGGISEALITTEFGLIVAIPSLLLHAFLSRKARGMIDLMEKTAISFMNQLHKTPYYDSKATQCLAELSPAQIQEIVRGIRQHDLGESHSSIPAFSENAIGRFMDQVVHVSKSATVNEVITKIRNSEIGADEDTIFVVDDDGKYVGDLQLRQLLLRPENTPVESLVEAKGQTVHVDTDKQEAHGLINQHGLSVLPVLDRNGCLVGRVRRNGNNGNGDH